MSQSDKEDKLEQESHVLGNGQLRSSSSLSSDHKSLHEVVKEMDDGGEGIEEPPVVQIEVHGCGLISVDAVCSLYDYSVTWMG